MAEFPDSVMASGIPGGALHLSAVRGSVAVYTNVQVPHHEIVREPHPAPVPAPAAPQA